MWPGITTYNANLEQRLSKRAARIEEMTELKVTLPDRLAREARKAGLLSTKAIQELLREAMRRRAARAFLVNAERVAAAGVPPMTGDEIQAEIDAVRRARRPRRGASPRR